MVYRVAGLADYERIKVVEPIRYHVVFIQSTIAGITIGFVLGILDIFLSKAGCVNDPLDSSLSLKDLYI